MNSFLVSKKAFALLKVLVKTAMEFAPDGKKGPHEFLYEFLKRQRKASHVVRNAL